ncbi:MAG: hypothetical protein M3228_14525 [Actinomycetota bacterium]|nr:hypothetical protein [Actinomycetota bacterium]
MSTGIAGKPVRGSTQYLVPISTAWPWILWVTGAGLLVTMLVHITALVVTGGPWTGPVSLRKPATFAETGWLACWSVALILPAVRTRAWQRHLVGIATVLFGVGETAIIGFQVWRGVPSHYNFTTPLDAALMRGGAAGTAGVFLVATLVLLVAAARSSSTPASVRLGVLAGIAVLFMGCAIGLVMIFNNSGVYQGSIGAGFAERTTGYLGPSPATIGPDYVLIKPATSGSDLVLLHAIGVHGLVLLAVPAVLLARTAMPAARQLRVVALAVAAVGVATAILAAHAFRELPWNQLSTLALAALVLCTVALLAAYRTIAAALRLRHRTEE